jgi:lipoprotein-anchoring transpeptidase ErfK/SrfK
MEDPNMDVSMRILTVGLALGVMMLSGNAAMGSPGFRGDKRVVVDKATQTLRGYEGNQLVFQSHVSTGRYGRETPDGRYHVQSKSLMHYSHRYGNAPMPYSVQFAGNYFIHGFSSVPDRPASHGCIRMPLSGEAQQFYSWVNEGTPVTVTGQWGRQPVGEKLRRR